MILHDRQNLLFFPSWMQLKLTAPYGADQDPLDRIRMWSS